MSNYVVSNTRRNRQSFTIIRQKNKKSKKYTMTKMRRLKNNKQRKKSKSLTLQLGKGKMESATIKECLSLKEVMQS
jgi:hypothetical protein